MTFDKILRTLLLGGIFLVPFIPFILSNDMFFPFITGKNFAFRILAEILFAGWLILALRVPAYRPTFSWILVALSAFVGIIAIADITGANASKSIWSNFERMEGLVTLVHLFMYFVVVGTVLNTHKLWNAFLHTSVGVSVLMVFYGMLQLAGEIVINQGGTRVDARLGNAAYLAIYMVFSIFITLFLMARWRGGVFAYWVYGIIVLMQGYILYHTATRGAILGLIGGLAFSALLSAILERDRLLLRRVSIGVVLTIVVAVSGFMMVRDADFVQDSIVLSRFANMSIDSGTVQSRFVIWDMAWQGVKERPILGWGQENFNLVFNKYYNPVLFSHEPWFDRVHNIILDWLIAGGFAGLFAYLSIYGAVLYQLIKDKHSNFSTTEKNILLGLFAAYGFHNFFVFDNIISYIYFITVLGLIYHLTRKPLDEDSVLNHEFPTATIDRLVTPVVLIALVLSIYAVNTKHILASQTLINALRPHQEGAAENLKYFREALAYKSLGQQETREQLVQSASRAARQQGIDPTVRTELAEYAIEQMSLQIEEAPNDARHELFLATLYEAYGRYDEAGAHYERAVELSPNKQTIRFGLGSNYLNRNMNEQALALFKNTLELEPAFQDAHVMYAIAAIYSSEDQLADDILANVVEQFSEKVLSNDRITKAYLDRGLHDKALANIEVQLKYRPNDRNILLNKVLVLVRSEKRDEATAVLDEIVELYPDFAQQGEQLKAAIEAGQEF